MRRIKNISKRIAVAILAEAIMMTSASATVLLNPTVVYAAQVDDNNDTSGTVNVSEGDSMSKNKGKIDENRGYVRYNYGTITTNNGEVFNNRTYSKGKIVTNNGTVAGNGTGLTNNGEDDGNGIRTNNGTVTTNYENGYINDNQGAVHTNQGLINTNEGNDATIDNAGYIAKGVHENAGIITDNTGLVAVNTSSGTVTNNKGTVTLNRGTVTNNSGKITTNDVKTIGNNLYTGKVDNNNGEIATNNGLVENNHGVIENNVGNETGSNGSAVKGVKFNLEDGEITTNSGYVRQNYGTIDINDTTGYVNANNDSNRTDSHTAIIKVNKGTVNINSETVTLNTGTINHNEGTVTNNFGNVGCRGDYTNDGTNYQPITSYIVNQYDGVLTAVAADGTERNDTVITNFFGGTINGDGFVVENNFSDQNLTATNQYRSVSFVADKNSSSSYVEGFKEVTLKKEDGSDEEAPAYFVQTSGEGAGAGIITVSPADGCVIVETDGFTTSGIGRDGGSDAIFSYTVTKNDNGSYSLSVSDMSASLKSIGLDTFKLAVGEKRSVTVKNGDGSGNYVVGATVSIKARAAATGKKFKEWTSPDGVRFANAGREETTFVMSDKDVTVEAVYEDIIYMVKATNDGHGTATATPASGKTGTSVTIKASPESGYDFKEWKIISGGVTLADTKNPSTTFEIGSADVEVKAIFVQKATPDPAKIDISKATVTLSAKSFTYKNKAQCPAVRSVVLGNKTLNVDKDYTVLYPNKSSKNAGTYKVTVTGIGEYTGSVTMDYKINQAKNPLIVKVKKDTLEVTCSKLKKKNRSIKPGKYLTVKKAQGKVSYEKTKGNKSISVNSKTGRITIKKGLKKGKYTVKISVRAAGNKNYKAALKKIKVKIVVK